LRVIADLKKGGENSLNTARQEAIKKTGVSGIMEYWVKTR
jgi:hypothetical protein